VVQLNLADQNFREKKTLHSNIWLGPELNGLTLQKQSLTSASMRCRCGPSTTEPILILLPVKYMQRNLNLKNGVQAISTVTLGYSNLGKSHNEWRRGPSTIEPISL
jgi:hypothetical protein